MKELEVKAATDDDNFDVPVEGDDMADPTLKRSGAPLTHSASVPVEQNPKPRMTAVGLGLPAVSTVAVAFPLSGLVQRFLGAQTQELSAASSSLWTRLYNLVDTSEIIWQNEARGGVAVMKCSENIVVKMVPNFEDYTEYTIQWNTLNSMLQISRYPGLWVC